MEQPGCLHAGMDLYKWAFKLPPPCRASSSMDCFDLAREIRELDMQASPYDLRELGYDAGADRDAAGQGGVCRRAARLRSPRPGPARPAPRRASAGLRPVQDGQRAGTPALTRPYVTRLDQRVPGGLDDVGGDADRLPGRLCRRRSR